MGSNLTEMVDKVSQAEIRLRDITNDGLNRASALSYLAAALHERFEQSRSITDINDAIIATRQDLTMTPKSSSSLVESRHNLVSSTQVL